MLFIIIIYFTKKSSTICYYFCYLL